MLVSELRVLQRLTSLSVPATYAVAVGTAVLSILLRQAMEPMWGMRLPYIFFFPAILMSGWVGGLGPGLVCTVMTGVAAEYLFLAPGGSWRVSEPYDVLGLVAFLVVGVAISVLSEAWRRETARVRRLLESERLAHGHAEETAGRLQIALESGRLGTWEYRIADGSVRWSPTLEAIHGYEPGAFPGTFQAFREEIHPDDRAHVLAAITDSSRGDRPHHVEYRIMRRDGVVRWVEGRGQLFRDGAGNPERMVGVCVDVTDRKQADERFRMALEAAPVAIILADHAGTIVMANAFTEKLLGYDRGELVGAALDRLVPERYRATHARHREGFRRDMRSRAMGAGRELFALRKDGSEVPVEIGLSPVLTERNSFVLAALTDVTDRRRIREELVALKEKAEELNRMKDQFLASLSHELRTPINAIMGYAQLLAMDTLPEDRVAHALDSIERNAKSQARLIDSLLDLSRIHVGNFELHVATLDLAAVLARAMDVVRPAADARGVQLELAPVPGIVGLQGDAERLQQVFWNLLANAVKFTPRGGRVTVRVERAANDVRIEIADSGRGIRAEFLPHVFERFAQGERSDATGEHRGLGLGLAIVSDLVQAHGGTVTAASPGPGHGSTFTVALPIEASPAHADARLPAPLPEILKTS